MLLARYAPIGSKRYEKLAQAAKSIDKIMDWIPAQLFGIWTIFVAGMAIGKAQTDRFYFWDWSDWAIGLIGLLIITLIIGFLGIKQRYISINDISASYKSIGYHLAFSYVLFGIGFLLFNTISVINAILCVIVYLAIYLIHIIKCDKSEWIIISQNEKNVKTGVSILLLIIAGVIGYTINDPVLSTAAIVSLPFLVVLLFGRHIRHLERAKFYPIFIFAMFVVSREAWFLIPLLLLFFILRGYNYLRYQRVYPTFGVKDDQS